MYLQSVVSTNLPKSVISIIPQKGVIFTICRIHNPAKRCRIYNPAKSCRIYNPAKRCRIYNPAKRCRIYNPAKRCHIYNPAKSCRTYNPAKRRAVAVRCMHTHTRTHAGMQKHTHAHICTYALVYWSLVSRPRCGASVRQNGERSMTSGCSFFNRASRLGLHSGLEPFRHISLSVAVSRRRLTSIFANHGHCQTLKTW